MSLPFTYNLQCSAIRMVSIIKTGEQLVLMIKFVCEMQRQRVTLIVEQLEK